MEPQILLIGRLQSTLDILVEELTRYGRNVIGSNDRGHIARLLSDAGIDFVVIGGGLDDASRSDMEQFVRSVSPSVPVHLVPRTPTANPASVIPFVNEHSVLFKVNAAANEKRD